MIWLFYISQSISQKASDPHEHRTSEGFLNENTRQFEIVQTFFALVPVWPVLVLSFCGYFSSTLLRPSFSQRKSTDA